ncbi:YqgE/AlgH family protein [Mucilaginibacter ginkgonis]|uniref:YqgE/AlgH family protein n=1 Tax=Mucilaginibacter ginkgonis TaxID=2682091 RepID=A0A6I4I347_9SPHI|nr:YqgE/AlgH family protein [Mucilaginibacter ginkgonis]QQL48396.1 YqgE/AlgH family protein [Mucilaginibacter ginkgonis]
MLSNVVAAPGRLLISEPFMMDPNFKRSVVLLTEHTEDGSVGFVLNQQSVYLLSDVLPNVSYSDLPVFIGGPVGTDTLHFIHCVPEKISGGIEIATGIFWGGDFEHVKDLVSTYQVTEDEIKFFAGYSGWSGGQLEYEINENAWIVASKFDTDTLFKSDDQELWKEVIISLGQRYAHIVNFPENPMLN